MRIILFITFSMLLLSSCSYEKNYVIKAKAEEPTIKKQTKEKSRILFNFPPPVNHSEQTPTFTMNEKMDEVVMLHKIRGEKSKFGFLDKPLIKNKEIELKWLFWKIDEKQPSGELKINGTHRETSQEVIAKGKTVEKTSPTKDLPKEYTVTPLKISNTFSNDNNINENTPVSQALTSISFPQSGIWELEVSVNEKVIGSIKVYVMDYETNVYYLND